MDTRRLSWHLPMKIACYAIPILVIFSIWIPVFGHYYVPDVFITNEMVNKARKMPTDQVLEELSGFRFFSSGWERDEKQLVKVAQKLLKGEVTIPDYPAININMPFDETDLDKGTIQWQSAFAGFIVPEVLLDAYRLTGRNEFLMMARDVILSWAQYERHTWFPTGLLWNDTAIAMRVLVLAEFWHLYRNHPGYDPRVANVVLTLAARNSQLLAKPSFFTFSTNHGIMQNLALWHFCLAFPSLPNVERYKRLALKRMHDQMGFYINEEGVVLEHSPSYQRLGLDLIGMAFRMLTLMHQPIPEEWIAKYERGKDVLARLRRPDGSLPVFGDTGNAKDPLGPLVVSVNGDNEVEKLGFQNKWIPKQPFSLYPVARYSIWWDGLDNWPNKRELSQTVVAWSYFPGHAHKHADEMSVSFWAAGETWWTNIGYWPYGTPGRAKAVSWTGSNAPHLINEDADSSRNTRLLSYGWSDYVAAIDLERNGPNGYVARRQLIYLRPNLWMVIDSSRGDDKMKTRTVWTTSHDVSLGEGKISGSYNLKSKNTPINLKAFFFISEGTTVNTFRGNLDPFLGWEGVDKPSYAIVVDQPANGSWSAIIWSLDNKGSPLLRLSAPPKMVYWEDAEDWEIALPNKSGITNVRRERLSVFVDDNNGMRDVMPLKLKEAPDISERVYKIRAGYINSSNNYPKFVDYLGPRTKVTFVLIFIFVVQEVFFVLYKKKGGRHYANIRVLSLLGWIGGGVLIYFFFNLLTSFYSALQS